MKDVCRDPWGLKRIVRRHQDQTGLVLYGRFNRLRGWLPHGDWDAVLVRVDGRDREVLDQVKRGPVWVPLDAGDHVVEFLGGRDPLHVERLQLREKEGLLIAFKPQEWIPLLGPTRDKWCVRPLWGGRR